MKWKTTRIRNNLYRGLSYLLAITAIGFYLYQSFVYSHELESNLDEGAYLYKGYLFVTRQYKLFQAYGTTSYHMPLSYLIPGYIQVLFGPGLEAGRNFMLALALFFLVGLWLLSRRLGGLWWATASVWLLALNPIVIKMYSLAVSQGLVACMFIWVLVLTIGDGRPMWQIILGSILASLLVMTRINMIMLLPLLALYIFWQHGKNSGWLAVLAMGVIQIGFYMYYWPGILRIWARFVPLSILAPWRLPRDLIPLWNPATPMENEWLSFFRAVRFHFVFVAGAMTSWLLLPLKNILERENRYRTFIFFVGFISGLDIDACMGSSNSKLLCLLHGRLFGVFFLSRVVCIGYFIHELAKGTCLVPSDHDISRYPDPGDWSRLCSI
jgi:hypothetical protein